MNQKEQFENAYRNELVFLKEKGRLVDDWSNVYDHCVTEGLVASVFADILHFSEREQGVLIRAALLHDWYKRNEREAAEALGAAQYDIKAGESSRLLRNAGYSEEVVTLTGSVGHTSLRDIQHTDNFLRRLMHYIDDVTWGNVVVTLDERMDQLEQAERYQALNESGRSIFGGRTYFEVQRDLGHVIENDIAMRLGRKPHEVILFIKEQLQLRYGVS